MRIRNRIFAGDDIMDEPNTMPEDMDEGMDEGGAQVDVAPEATDLLFEAEDVAELVAEVTGEPVDVVADGDVVTFTVGDQEVTIEADGDEELVQSATRIARGRKPVRASANRRPANRRPAVAPKQKVSASARVFRKVPSGK